MTEAGEFSRRRSIPHVEVKMSHTKRTNEVSLSLCGKHLGTKVEILKRGKVIETTFDLPKID